MTALGWSALVLEALLYGLFFVALMGLFDAA